MSASTEPTDAATVSADVRRFFAEFERANNVGDYAASASQFAQTFLSLDPNRVVAVPHAAFVAALPQRTRLFESIGRTSTRLVSIAQTDLDERHVMVDTEWSAEIVDASGRPDCLPLSSVFILRREPDGLQVVLYLNRQDIVETITARRGDQG